MLNYLKIKLRYSSQKSVAVGVKTVTTWSFKVLNLARIKCIGSLTTISGTVGKH